MKRWMSIPAFLALAVAVLSALPAPPVSQAPQSRLRVVQAIPDAPAVDVLFDVPTIFCNLPFMTVTHYRTLAPAAYTVQVIPSTSTALGAAPTPAGTRTPGTPAAPAPLIVSSASLSPNVDYTLAILGMASSAQTLLLTDDNSAPPAGQAKIRFVNASPNAPAVDVALSGGPTLASNLPFRGVGNYMSVPRGTHTLQVRAAGTKNVILTIPNVMLEQGVVYTSYAVGLASGQPPLQGLISIDSVDGTPAPTG